MNKTPNDFIHWAATQFIDADLFYGHGTDNAEDEALQLILHALGWTYDIHPSQLDQSLTESQKSAIRALISRRIKEKIPAPYLTHCAYFAGLTFYVDERVIIPRSPIAELIHQRFKPWLKEKSYLNILDLCTGSACIAIACAHVFEDAQVDAVDLSEDALDVAEMNIQQHQLEQRVRLFKSDLFAQLPQKRYDLIVSNPPYVDAADIHSMPSEFSHEPMMALAAGEDGLDLVKIILKQAADYLTEEGILIVEVGNSAEALAAAYPNLPFTWLNFEHGGEGVFLLTADQLLMFSRR